MMTGCTCIGTDNTYGSILTVQVVSTGMSSSGCEKAGKLLLGTLAGVHLDSGERIFRIDDSTTSHHDTVLKSNSTSITANKDDIYSNKTVVVTWCYMAN